MGPESIERTHNVVRSGATLLGFLLYKIPSIYNDRVVTHYRDHSENTKPIGQSV